MFVIVGDIDRLLLSRVAMRSQPPLKDERTVWAEPPIQFASLDEDAAIVLRTAVRHVADCLPWRSAYTGELVGMAVLEAGWLEEDDLIHRRGSPFVSISVDSWDAADAVRDSLRHIAGLDEAAWALDWTPCQVAFRMIRVFPNPDDF